MSDAATTIGDALYWTEVSVTQARRFLSAFRSASLEALESRSRGSDAPPSDTGRWRRDMYLADGQFLIIAVRHLSRALARLPKAHTSIRLSTDVEAATGHLRNVLEHWDEQRPAFEAISNRKSRSGLALSNLYPECSPWGCWARLNDKLDVTIAGVLDVDDLLGQLLGILGSLQAIRDLELGTTEGTRVRDSYFREPTWPMASAEALAAESFLIPVTVLHSLESEGVTGVVLSADYSASSRQRLDVVFSRKASDGWRFVASGGTGGGYRTWSGGQRRGIVYGLWEVYAYERTCPGVRVTIGGRAVNAPIRWTSGRAAAEGDDWSNPSLWRGYFLWFVVDASPFDVGSVTYEPDIGEFPSAIDPV